MPLPRISGVLNNCPLHALTPELRTEINLLANGGSTVSRDFMPAYALLKTTFAEFYNISSNAFTWQAFNALLNKHNDFDLQMILGPVLRSVMAAQMRADQDKTNVALWADEDANDMDFDTFIDYKTGIQADGRYASMSPDELFTFLAGPLGLAVVFHKDERREEYPNDPQQQSLFAGRPCVEMFHQGGVEGAGAGGHFERTLDVQDRIDSEQAHDVHLRIVAEFCKLDSPDITMIAMDLLRLYIKIQVRALTNGDSDMNEMFHTFHVTVAQIEKFLYNRLYVSEDNAKVLLGNLTPETEALIDRIPALEAMDYDEGIHTLLSAHLNYDTAPVKRAPMSRQQYDIALTLLTPAVPQRQAHRYRRSPELLSEGIWALCANEISALQSLTNEYAEHIIFDEGLSGSLYALCNRPEIAPELLPEFLRLLASDPYFTEKASEELQRVVTSRPLLTPEANTRHARRSVFDSASMVCEERSPLFPDLMSSPARSRAHPSNPHTPCSGDAIYIPAIYGASKDGSDEELGTDARDFGMMAENPYRKAASSRVTPAQDSSRLSSTARKLFDDHENGLKSTESSLPGLPVSRQGTENEKRQAPPSQANTYFWLRAIQCCLAVGGVCAVIAVLTCPPVAAALGLTTVFGAAVSDVAVTATFFAGTSVLLAASMFAVKQITDDPVIECTNLRFGGGS